MSVHVSPFHISCQNHVHVKERVPWGISMSLSSTRVPSAPALGSEVQPLTGEVDGEELACSLWIMHITL